MNINISDAIKYIGVDDKDIDLFESQYIVPNGISYNSYVILDEKICVLDTVDKRKTDEWVANLENVLDGKTPDYLIINHLEPDHASNIQLLADKYPDMKLVGNAKTFNMLPQFFDIDLTDRTVTVKEGDSLNLGEHTLSFYMAPMVHWPEVMVTYESKEKVLFLPMDSVNSVHLIQTKIGLARQEDITLIFAENTVCRFRLCLKKQLSLTLRKSVRYTVLFLLKISVIILTFMTSGASMSRRLTVYLSLIVQFMAIPKKPL